MERLIGGSSMNHGHENDKCQCSHEHVVVEENHGHDHTHVGHHGSSIFSELMCHFPYAIFSVAFSLAILSLLGYITCSTGNPQSLCRGAHLAFHSFHFLHIVFAATGTLIAFFRFSSNVPRALFVGVFSTLTFCTLSDSVLPYLAGRLLGVEMEFHLCFVSELRNIVPFLIVGLINGLIMGKYHIARGGFYSVFSHFFHILVSSLAATFYIVSHGLTNWYHVIGMLFLFLVIAVVVPCTLSDVVVPMAAAKAGKKNERN